MYSTDLEAQNTYIRWHIHLLFVHLPRLPKWPTDSEFLSQYYLKFVKCEIINGQPGCCYEANGVERAMKDSVNDS